MDESQDRSGRRRERPHREPPGDESEGQDRRGRRRERLDREPPGGESVSSSRASRSSSRASVSTLIQQGPRQSSGLWEDSQQVHLEESQKATPGERPQLLETRKSSSQSTRAQTEGIRVRQLARDGRKFQEIVNYCEMCDFDVLTTYDESRFFDNPKFSDAVLRKAMAYAYNGAQKTLTDFKILSDKIGYEYENWSLSHFWPSRLIWEGAEKRVGFMDLETVALDMSAAPIDRKFKCTITLLMQIDRQIQKKSDEYRSTERELYRKLGEGDQTELGALMRWIREPPPFDDIEKKESVFLLSPNLTAHDLIQGAIYAKKLTSDYIDDYKALLRSAKSDLCYEGIEFEEDEIKPVHREGVVNLWYMTDAEIRALDLKSAVADDRDAVEEGTAEYDLIWHQRKFRKGIAHLAKEIVELEKTYFDLSREVTRLQAKKGKAKVTEHVSRPGILESPPSSEC